MIIRREATLQMALQYSIIGLSHNKCLLHAGNEEDQEDIPDSFNGCFGLYDELGVNAGNLECMDCQLRTACMAMSGGASC